MFVYLFVYLYYLFSSSYLSIHIYLSISIYYLIVYTVYLSIFIRAVVYIFNCPPIYLLLCLSMCAYLRGVSWSSDVDVCVTKGSRRREGYRRGRLKGVGVDNLRGIEGAEKYIRK